MLGKTPASTTVASGKVFPGQYYDQETGLHYNYFRYYDPETGRYLTADPLGIIEGEDFNLYAYVGNNPLIWADIFGLRRVRGRGGDPSMAGRGSGRVGVFGCVGGCASYTQGDAEAQASLSPTIGGGLMLCSPKPKQQEACDVEKPDPVKKDCGMYDPNCDNNAQPTFSITRGGAGIGFSRNADGSFCVLIGPFVSYPLIAPSMNLGGLSE